LISEANDWHWEESDLRTQDLLKVHRGSLSKDEEFKQVAPGQITCLALIREVSIGIALWSADSR
jgi:hypothetical protein